MEPTPKRVLMVDDDVTLCESMQDYLLSRPNEYKFLGGVCTFSEALKLFKDGMPHIVILDMMLGPGLDGSDLLEDFQKIEKEQGFKSNIFVYSKNGFYESFCVSHQLMFMQKGGNNPELIIKRIERFISFAPNLETVIKIDIAPPEPEENACKIFCGLRFPMWARIPMPVTKIVCTSSRVSLSSPKPAIPVRQIKWSRNGDCNAKPPKKP